MTKLRKRAWELKHAGKTLREITRILRREGFTAKTGKPIGFWSVVGIVSRTKKTRTVYGKRGSSVASVRKAPSSRKSEIQNILVSWSAEDKLALVGAILSGKSEKSVLAPVLKLHSSR